MSVATLANLEKSFGTRVVFDRLNLNVEQGERLGLIGPNGSGKTTLFKVLTGEVEPEAGQVAVARGTRVGYLSQDPTFDPANAVIDEAELAFAELHTLAHRLRDIEHEMAHLTGDALEKTLNTYQSVQHDFELAGGYAWRHRLEATLLGVGLPRESWEQSVTTLSGGQRSRLALAKLLISEPDLLLLDEPTNHLDLAAIEWLEKYLLSFGGAVVLISHDRYLLDRLATRIIWLNRAKLSSYPGNYSAFLQQKELQELTQQRQYNEQQADIEKQKEFIRRFGAGQRSKEAKGREKRLERFLQSDQLVEAVTSQKKIRIALGTDQRAGDQVLQVRELSKAFPVEATREGEAREGEGREGEAPAEPRSDECAHSAKGEAAKFSANPQSEIRSPQSPAVGEPPATKTLWRDIAFDVRRGDRIGVIGPNGSGKTTLLKVLLGEADADAGSVRWGANLNIGYYDQRLGMEEFHPENTIAEEVRGDRVGIKDQDLRNVLATLLFRGDDIDKQIKLLSGGERARVRLAQLLLDRPNVLVLDEPTNHLDVASCEALERALADFPGTILCVSHDRYFLDHAVNRMLILDPPGIADFNGNYTAWATKQAERGAEAQRKASGASRTKSKTTTPVATPSASPKPSSAQKKDNPYLRPFGRLSTKELEQQITDTEIAIAECQATFGDPEAFRDPTKGQKQQAEYKTLTEKLEALEAEYYTREA